MSAIASESHCNNGGCTRPVYRGKECFRCWSGTKWTSIILRLRNSNGKCKSYIGVPIGFSRESFLQWISENPPPPNLSKPSIDRIIGHLGYVPGNVRWIEHRKNSAGVNRDLPIGFVICPKCNRTLPISSFGINRNRGKYRQGYCRECKLKYDRQWRSKQKSE